VTQAQTAGRGPQLAIGAAALVLAGVLAWGASQIPSAAGYAGVGPNFMPWVVALALALCGAGLLLEAASGGYRHRGAIRRGARRLAWPGWRPVANAALITVWVSSHLLASWPAHFLAEGRPAAADGARLATGFLAAPASGFPKLLAINLPGLTGTGWL
jgi:putative tricarboxylic transport membrane protein